MTGNDAAERADSTEVSVPEDGEYTVEVTLEGGSGKATVDSQAKVTVTDGGHMRRSHGAVRITIT